MTRLLLDTHALVWAISAPARLSEDARAAIADRRIGLLVSAASAWELATKFRLGRFPDAEVLVAQFSWVLDQLGAQELAMTAEHALRAGGLRWTHRDPFDRMLAAQALILNVPLISRDSAFASLPGLQVRW